MIMNGKTNEEIIAEGKANLKEDFEIDRDEILKDLPAEYTDKYGTIGYAKFSGKFYLALILNPYDVPPGSVREKWLEMFEKSESDYYGFVQRTLFIEYEDFSKKKRKGMKVDKNPNAIKEVEEDLAIDPKDRRRGVTDFKEGWEMIDDDEILQTYLGGQEEDPFTQSDDEKIKSALAASDDQDEALPPKKRKLDTSKADKETKTKKRKNGNKKKSKQALLEPESIEQSKTSMDGQIVADYNDFGDDEGNEDEKEEPSEASEPEPDYKDDEDFEEIPKKGKPKKPKIPGSHTKRKLVKKSKEVKRRKPEKLESEASPTRSTFSSEIFDVMCAKWDVALENKSVEQLPVLFMEIQQNMAFLSKEMLEKLAKHYMAQTKTLLKAEGKTLSEYSALKQAMKDAYRVWNSKTTKETPSNPSPQPKDSSAESNHTRHEMNSQDSVPKAVPIPKKSGSQASFTSGTASEPASSEAPVTLVNERQSLLSLSKRTDAERTNSLPSAAAKDKSKKKFSFGSLVQQSAQKPKNPETNSVTKSDEKLDVLESVNDDSSVKVSWISEIANDESLPKFRSFALRFFVQLAEQFPPDKVNIYGFARSLEKAVYERCNGTETNDAWKSSYWDKVHALVAAIAGKNKKGTLFHLILDGSFQSPDELAKLSDDVLEESFEERAVNI